MQYQKINDNQGEKVNIQIQKDQKMVNFLEMKIKIKDQAQ